MALKMLKPDMGMFVKSTVTLDRLLLNAYFVTHHWSENGSSVSGTKTYVLPLQCWASKTNYNWDD